MPVYGMDEAVVKMFIGDRHPCKEAAQQNGKQKAGEKRSRQVRTMAQEWNNNGQRTENGVGVMMRILVITYFFHKMQYNLKEERWQIPLEFCLKTGGRAPEGGNIIKAGIRQKIREEGKGKTHKQKQNGNRMEFHCTSKQYAIYKYDSVTDKASHNFSLPI